MPIHVLDQNTINKIAAGEVVERPSSVVKELVENAIDAGSNAVTVEIKDGGISFIRITDNGDGIDGKEIPAAFLRHSTSKIKSVEDLLTVSSLGFRGEALSSIAAVSQVEMITKTEEELSGFRYVIEGGEEKLIEEIGAPKGTTFVVRNLFYNTPVRRKFLKTAATEAGYIGSLLEHLSLSHPDISFRFINNNQNRLTTPGNGNLKDVVYSVYGRDITRNLIEISASTQDVKMTGFLGKPMINRGNRTYENYYINGRYIKSGIITKAIEEAYKGFIMPHNYPFTAIHFDINPAIIDVNVHPQKMEMRFSKNDYVYNFVLTSVRDALRQQELVPEVKTEPVQQKQKVEVYRAPQMKPLMTDDFSTRNKSFVQRDVSNNNAGNDSRNESRNEVKSSIHNDSTLPFVTDRAKVAEKYTNTTAPSMPDFIMAKHEEKKPYDKMSYYKKSADTGLVQESKNIRQPEPFEKKSSVDMIQEENERISYGIKNTEQMSLFDNKLLDKSERSSYRIIGQLFETYWLIEFEDKFYIMDQHAAHEKVLYEQFMKRIDDKKMDVQMIMPPIILSLNLRQEDVLKKYAEIFKETGFEIEEFGGNEYKVSGVPALLPNVNLKQLLIDMIDEMTEDDLKGQSGRQAVAERVATMACKAAVKGNNKLSFEEAGQLIKDLMEAENPYNCPHGRPTLIKMTKYEIERKFKRII